jgi:hypothetical protein
VDYINLLNKWEDIKQWIMVHAQPKKNEKKKGKGDVWVVT